MKEVAVVMSGGGAGGSIEVGMLDALSSRGYEFTSAYGVSTGALNAAGLAFRGLDGLKDIWFNLNKNSDIFVPNWLGGPFFGDSLYKSGPLRAILEKSVLGEPHIPATVAAVDLLSGSLVYDYAGSQTFLETTLASASVPLHAPPVRSGDKMLVDGGVRDITPLSKAIKDGHNHIVILLARPWAEAQAGNGMVEYPTSRWFRGVKIAAAAVNILADEIFKTDIKMCLLKNKLPEYRSIHLEVYAPHTRTIATNEFNQLKIKENYAYGYSAAMNGPVIESEAP